MEDRQLERSQFSTLQRLLPPRRYSSPYPVQSTFSKPIPNLLQLLPSNRYSHPTLSLCCQDSRDKITTTLSGENKSTMSAFGSIQACNGVSQTIHFCFPGELALKYNALIYFQTLYQANVQRWRLAAIQRRQRSCCLCDGQVSWLFDRDPLASLLTLADWGWGVEPHFKLQERRLCSPSSLFVSSKESGEKIRHCFYNAVSHTGSSQRHYIKKQQLAEGQIFKYVQAPNSHLNQRIGVVYMIPRCLNKPSPTWLRFFLFFLTSLLPFFTYLFSCLVHQTR